jgi:hypothetical protein
MAKKENRLYFNTPVFEEDGYIGEDYTCDGYERSPPFFIADAPENTKSFVLIMDDIDSHVKGGKKNHWVMWNIPLINEIEEGIIPYGAIVGVNDFGGNEYVGPCPQVGEHRFEFKLYAIDQLLNIDENSTKKELLDAIEGKILAQNCVVCKYKRDDITQDEYSTL